MADSTLEHDASTPAVVSKGHGTAALGPSDSSDSGSDIQGGPGLEGDPSLFQRNGAGAPDAGDELASTAGADIGDADLDSDSDRNGTGERGAAGRDDTVPVDTLLRDTNGDSIDGETIGDDEDAGTSADDGVGKEDSRAKSGETRARQSPVSDKERPAR